MVEALQIAARCIVAPAAIALAVNLVLRPLLNAQAARHFPAAIALSVAYCAGFALVRPWDEFAPSRHWHWTVYVALAAAIVGPIITVRRIHWLARTLLLLATCLAAAWLLVPTWNSLQPSRLVWIPILAGYFSVLAAGLAPLASFVPEKRLLGLMTLSAIGTAVLVAVGVSLTTFGQPACAAAATLAGCWVAAWLGGNADEVRGLALAYAVIIGGWAFVGCIDPPKPLLGLLIAPTAPLALWLFSRGPLARLDGISATVAQSIAVVVVLGIAAAAVLVPW